MEFGRGLKGKREVEKRRKRWAILDEVGRSRAGEVGTGW